MELNDTGTIRFGSFGQLPYFLQYKKNIHAETINLNFRGADAEENP
jgi:hypothetical protein